MAKRKRKAKHKPAADWASLPRERLLDLRICDLDLRLEGTEIERHLGTLHAELALRGFEFRPHCWLSDEWFSPDGVPGFAVPFWLAHPRLKRLEQEMMLEVEGGTEEHCLELMRHETGHALANAYRLHRRRDWQRHFGKSSQRYPKWYEPRPYSKRFVVHLDNWYAQSHPDEDWAETFAVWLRPDSDWRRKYRGWPAFRKLDYVDTLMKELRDEPPKVQTRETPLPVRQLRKTLRRYYQQKQALYGRKTPLFFDRDLRKLFVSGPGLGRHERAARYLRRNRMAITSIIARWTGEYRYRIDQVLEEMIKRCDELHLRVLREDSQLRLDLVALLTRLVVDYLHSGRYRVTV